jgi:hypothetical protein
VQKTSGLTQWAATRHGRGAATRQFELPQEIAANAQLYGAVFPLIYALQLAAAWLLLPAFWAGIYTVALPYTGYYALLYRDRLGSTFWRTRTFLLFLGNRAPQEQLVREGRAIIQQIRDLGDQLKPSRQPKEPKHEPHSVLGERQCLPVRNRLE